MARRKKVQELADTRIEPKRLWKTLSSDEYYDFARRVAPEKKWTISGKRVTCLCPYHDDHHPSMSLNFAQGFGRCFSCHKVVTDLVQFTSVATSSSYTETLLRLVDEFKLDKKLGKVFDGVLAMHKQDEMKKETVLSLYKLLEEYIRDKPDHLSYFAPAETYLRVARGVSTSDIITFKMPVMIWAKPAHIKQHMSQEYYTEFDAYFAKQCSSSHYGGLVFTYNDTPGTISRFKFRALSGDAFKIGEAVPFNEMTKETARALVSRDFDMTESGSGGRVGVFGLYFYNHLIGQQNSAVYITEGEFDALAIMQGQITEDGKRQFPVFAVGGGGGVDFGFLREYSVKEIFTLQDHQYKNGNLVVDGWLQSKGNNVVIPGIEPITYKVFVWPAILDEAGDIAEAVEKYGYNTVREEIYGQNAPHNFVSQLEWVKKRCDEEIALINDEDEMQRNANIVRTVQEFERNLPFEPDKIAFVSHYANQYNINLAALSSARRVHQGLDTVESCSKTMARAFDDYASIPFYEMKSNAIIYTIFNRRHKEITSLNLSSDTAMENLLVNCTGATPVEWTKSILGPEMITPPGMDIADDAVEYFLQERKRANTIIDQMFMLLKGRARPMDSMYEIGPGIHFIDLPKNTTTVYVNNGKSRYKGVYNVDGLPIDWKEVDDIVDGRYYFAVKNDPWSDTVQDVSDLYSGANINLQDLFKKIQRIVNEWSFEHDAVMKEYLPCWIMSLPVQLALNRVTVSFITGEHASGKTSFAQGLLGGINNTGHNVPYILEPANVTTDATPAYMYQSQDKSSLLLCIDEAETEGDTKHDQQNVDLQKILYSVPTGGSRIGRGSAKPGGASEYILKSPILLSAIKMPSDIVFLSRVVVIRTKTLLGKSNIGDVLCSMYSDSDLVDIRKAITTCLLDKLPKIIIRAKELSQRLMKLEGIDLQYSARFVDNIVVSLAVYELCGFDPVELFRGMVEANRQYLEDCYSSKNKSDLLYDALYTKCVCTDGGNIANAKSPRDLIFEGGDGVNTLNMANIGVYAIPEKECIVVYWRQAKRTVLGKSRYRNRSETDLCNECGKNLFVRHITDAEHSEIVGYLNLADAVSKNVYTVVDYGFLNIGEHEYSERSNSASAKKEAEEQVDEIESMFEF